MTLPERANALLDKFGFYVMLRDEYHKAFKVMIESELQAAVEEEVNDQLADICSEMIETTRNEALEKAAQVVEAFEPLRGIRQDVEKHDEGMREMLASSIRALKESK